MIGSIETEPEFAADVARIRRRLFFPLKSFVCTGILTIACISLPLESLSPKFVGINYLIGIGVMVMGTFVTFVSAIRGYWMSKCPRCGTHLYRKGIIGMGLTAECRSCGLSFRVQSDGPRRDQ